MIKAAQRKKNSMSVFIGVLVLQKMSIFLMIMCYSPPSGIAVLQITFSSLLEFPKLITVSRIVRQCDGVVVDKLGGRSILIEVCSVDGGRCLFEKC